MTLPPRSIREEASRSLDIVVGITRQDRDISTDINDERGTATRLMPNLEAASLNSQTKAWLQEE
jgi:hypothetical protein